MMPRSLLLLITSFTLATASTPRGVSPEDAKLYPPSASQSFTCLTHSSIQIPFSRVNDDFCDCPDGSDEPGTSACAGLPHTNVSIPGFYCRNTGHTAAFLPLSRVNDGICDYDICCDGSDEYLGVGGVNCPSKCKEIGIAARKMAAERNARKGKGSKARDELIKKAAVLRKEIEDNVAVTRVKIQATEINVQKLQQKLKEIEEQERNRVAHEQKLESKASVVAKLAKARVEELKSYIEKLQNQRDNAEQRLEKTVAILSVLKMDYNPNFNDEGVKRAVRAWEEYQADPLTATERNKAEDRDLQATITADDIDWDDLAKEEEIPEFNQFTRYLPPSVRTWLDTKLQEFRQFLVANSLLAPKPVGNESAAVTAARATLSTAESELSSNKQHIETLEKDLSLQLGPEDVFRPLKGTCISREFGEYKYEVCFMDNAYQISRKDNSKTSLGSFERIEVVDDSSKNEAKGVFASSWEESHEEPLSGMSLKYENGQQCWNGPKRSVEVQLYCCAENEIRSVVEAEKCVYRFEVGTPAVCENGNEKAKVTAKDEL
ncbi:glucosidase II beta subunit-like-domain-containing protein [Trichophaea hybrida]|nr:glucosidase II beta subunit-like-domain-containing protein [Trichophaea hybrida]